MTGAMWKLLLIPVLLYLAICAVAFFAQTGLLFPARLALPAGPPPPSAEPLELAAPDGHRLHGLHIPPSAPADERLLILGFGGNAWNAVAAAEYLHELYPQADVVAFHYRGYAPSGGSPGAAALRRDALLVHDFVRERLRPERAVAVGFSIGSGVAAFLAAHRPLDGAILVTPFDSLTELAAGHYSWLPVRLLLRHRMEPAADLRGTNVPVALIAAGDDRLVPAAHTEALARAVPNLAFRHVVPGAGHSDVYERDDFREAMRAAAVATAG
jgi:hypothetical protein